MVRHAVGVVAGAAATFALLWLMRSVIANPKSAVDSGLTGKVIEFVQIQKDEEVIVEVRKPKPPPPPKDPPPKVPRPRFDSTATSGVSISDVPVEVSVKLGGTGGFTSDGEYLPIVKVQPIYPRRALERGIEGYAVVEFVVTTTGKVRDPVVVEYHPSTIFNRAAIQAALKFKYKPKVVNGEPIEVAGVRNKIIFNLED